MRRNRFFEVGSTPRSSNRSKHPQVVDDVDVEPTAAGIADAGLFNAGQS
ncbi:hypothetical protein ACQEVB_37110 [Pseudonocardia sp. CA-107938]